MMGAEALLLPAKEPIIMVVEVTVVWVDVAVAAEAGGYLSPGHLTALSMTSVASDMVLPEALLTETVEMNGGTPQTTGPLG